MNVVSILKRLQVRHLVLLACVLWLSGVSPLRVRAQLDDWDVDSDSEGGVESEDEVEFDNDPEEPLDDEPLPSDPVEEEVANESEEESATDAAGSGDDLFAPPDDVPAPVAEPEPAERMLAVEFSGGLGGGTFRADIPKDTGHLALADSAFAAASAQVRVDVAPHSTLFGQVRLDYHTSLGLKVRMQPLFGLPESIRIRYQHFSIAVAPGLNLTDGERPVRLTLPLGYSLTALTPVEHQYPLKQLVLAGPEAGLELQAPLGERVTVRVGPGARLILVMNNALTDEGAKAPGLGLGGTVEVTAHISDVIHAGLAYREFHTMAPGSDSRYRSRERFLTARLGGEL